MNISINREKYLGQELLPICDAERAIMARGGNVVPVYNGCKRCWVEPSSGGSSGTLQDVTDLGNTTDNDIEITDPTKGIILTSPDLTRWRMTIDNSGTPIFTSL